jgi:hypothetical protein
MERKTDGHDSYASGNCGPQAHQAPAPADRGGSEVSQLRGDVLDDAFHGLLDGGRQALAGGEVGALDGVEDEARGQRAEGARHLDGLRYAERMGRVMEQVYGDGLRNGVNAADGSGRGAGARRIYEMDARRSAPEVHKPGAFARGLDDCDARNGQRLELSRGDKTGAVVAPQVVADADDKARPRYSAAAQGYSSSIVSFRK